MDAMFGSTFPRGDGIRLALQFYAYLNTSWMWAGRRAIFRGGAENIPELRGTIVYLPPVETWRATMERHGLGERVDFVPADFFADELPQGADMYVLGFILHDWDKARGTELLKKIYEALKPGGAVFVCETLLDGQRAGSP